METRENKCGLIAIQLHEKDKQIQLVIKDTGCGISNEIKGQLFTPFFTTKESGQGIGLMLIHEIFGMHDYSYQLENNDNNVGVRFILTIEL